METANEIGSLAKGKEGAEENVVEWKDVTSQLLKVGSKCKKKFPAIRIHNLSTTEDIRKS